MAFIDGVGKGKQVPVDLVSGCVWGGGCGTWYITRGTRGVRGVRGSGRTVVVVVLVVVLTVTTRGTSIRAVHQMS